MPRFDATILKAGVNPYVDVPDAIPATWRAVLVRVRRADGRRATKRPALDRNRDQLVRIGRLTSTGWFRTHLVPVRGAPRRLYLHGWMREDADAQEGDQVWVSIRADAAASRLPLPPALASLLRTDPAARKAWDALSPSARKEKLVYLNFLKTREARERAIARVHKQLVGRAR